jgi:hypothetical protein
MNLSELSHDKGKVAGFWEITNPCKQLISWPAEHLFKDERSPPNTFSLGRSR